MNQQERLGLIDESERLIEEACTLLKRAASGTQYENSADNVIRRITEAVGSDEAGSYSNLKKNITADSQDPIWTRPYASVKNCDRKDI